MNIIKKNLRDFLLDYDIFIIDVYKTLVKKGDIPFDGVLENLEFLSKHNKKVIIYSNYPLANNICFDKDQSKYLKSLNFEFYTSGELAHRLLKAKGYTKYFLIGARPIPGFTQVDDPIKAEFVYLDLPVLPNDDVTPTMCVTTDKFPDVSFSKSIAPFVAILSKIKDHKLKIYSGRPSIKDHMNIDGQKVISNAVIRDRYKAMKGDVSEIGKPSLEAYRYILKDVEKDAKILCIGDTMETDILGVENLKKDGYNAKSLLVLSGVSAKKDLEKYSYKPDFVVESFGMK